MVSRMGAKNRRGAGWIHARAPRAPGSQPWDSFAPHAAEHPSKVHAFGSSPTEQAGMQNSGGAAPSAALDTQQFGRWIDLDDDMFEDTPQVRGLAVAVLQAAPGCRGSSDKCFWEIVPNVELSQHTV